MDRKGTDKSNRLFDRYNCVKVKSPSPHTHNALPGLATVEIYKFLGDMSVDCLEYRLYGVIQDVVFTHQPHFSCSFLSLIRIYS